MKDEIIYIAGKITGFPGYEAKFAEAETYLLSKGAIPINPAKLPKGLSYEQYLHICFAMIDTSQSIYLLDNWAGSFGANREYGYGKGAGKGIYFQKRSDKICPYKMEMLDKLLKLINEK